MYIPSGELLAMALAAQAQRPAANQQAPMFNWNSLAGPPLGGMAEDSSMALTMPMPVPAPVAMPAPPPAMPVAMPQQAPVPIPADQMVQQMYAPVGAAPQQEMMPVPAPVYSMYPEAPQAQAQPMAPINLPGPSLTDLAAYEMFGPPVVPGPGYAPVAPQPLPQQTAWQQEPVGYNPMMMDATASELYGMPAPQPMAAAPTQFGFDPSALTGAAGATAMQTPTAMPQPMMAAGAPPQELPPLPPPPSMYVPGRQQPGVMAQRGPATGAVMPYQPMTDLGVPAEDLYQMFAGVSPDQPLAMLTQQGGGEGQVPSPLQSGTVAEQPATTQAQATPSGPTFTQEFKPFEIPYKTPSGKEFQAKVTSYDPKTGTAVLQSPTGKAITINRSTPTTATAFQAIDAKYQEQIAERSKVGPGNYEMLQAPAQYSNWPLRLAVKNADGKTVWTPARMTENNLAVDYYDPEFEETTQKPFRDVTESEIYDPGQQAFGAAALQNLAGKLIPAAVESAVGPYANMLQDDDTSPYTPEQLARMVQIDAELEPGTGMPTYTVRPITKFRSGTRLVQDEDGQWITEEYAEEVPDPRVPAGFTERLQADLDSNVQRFKKLGELNEKYLTAEPKDLNDIQIEMLNTALAIAKTEQSGMAPTSKEYAAKQKEIDKINQDIKDAMTNMTMRVGAGTVLTAQPKDLRISNEDPRSWMTIMGQLSGGQPNAGPGSQSRAGLDISPLAYAYNQALLHAQEADQNRGKAVNLVRRPEYDRASNIIMEHIGRVINEGAAFGQQEGLTPQSTADYVNDLYTKDITFQVSGKKTVKQTLFEATNELASAQREMNVALKSGDMNRIIKAENKLREQMDKFRGGFQLPNGFVANLDDTDPNAFDLTDRSSMPNLYDRPAGIELTQPGRAVRAGQTATLQPEKIEGMGDRGGSGPKTPPPTSIRPIILGAMNKGFRGNNSGVMQASATDPTQFDYFSGQLGNKTGIEDFSKVVMQGGLYGESGSGFGDAENVKAADALFKGMNTLMFEDSPAGTEMRKAYARAFYNMLLNSSGFDMAVGADSFANMFEDAFQNGNSKDLLGLVNGKNLANIASKFGGSNIYQGLFKSPYIDYFKPGRKLPQEAKLFETARIRALNLATVIGRAKNGGLKNTGHPLGMNPHSGEQYVFFANPFVPGAKSLLALPAVGYGYSSGSAKMLKKAEADALAGTGQLPATAAPYDIPAAMMQLNSGSVFSSFNEEISQALEASTDPDVKAVVREIAARQAANHRQDMSSAPARAGSDNNTKLDNDGKEIGRRWLIEGGLIYNIFYPTRNSTVIP